MTLAIDVEGKEALILTLTDVAKALKINAATIMELWARDLFPEPIHHFPPLWPTETILSWAAAASDRERPKSTSKRRTKAK